MRTARRAGKETQVINREYQVRAEADKFIRLAGILRLNFSKFFGMFLEQVSQFPDCLRPFALLTDTHRR